LRSTQSMTSAITRLTSAIASSSMSQKRA
jgi:hypothetical protein